MKIETESQKGIKNGEEFISLYKVFGYLYDEKNGNAWSPYLKRNIPCQVWNDNKELSHKTASECTIKSFNTKDIKDCKKVMSKYSVNEPFCLVIEIQTCLLPKKVWTWAKSIDEKKISKKRKTSYFAYENGGIDLDEYISNEVDYKWESNGIAFRLDGTKISKTEMREIFYYFNWENATDIFDISVEKLSNIQIELAKTDISAADYNGISEMIGNLKELIINCESYNKNVISV